MQWNQSDYSRNRRAKSRAMGRSATAGQCCGMTAKQLAHNTAQQGG